ncbi:MAG: hypothetical protein ACE5EW_04455 [Thermoplasmata archaeon]
MAEEGKARTGIETFLVIMIPVATVLAGFAGFFAADEQRGSNRAREAGFIALSDANTNALVANQIILRDEQLLIRAEIAERDGDLELAMELRSRAFSFEGGYIDLSGNATPAYGGDLERAKDAFIEDMYAPHRANKTASEQAFAQARIESQQGLNYLLATILFAATAVLGTFANGMKSPGRRRVLFVVTVGFLVIPVSIVILTVFGIV